MTTDVFQGHKLEARRTLQATALYPEADALAEFGTEKYRAENTLSIVKALPYIEADDLYAVHSLVSTLSPGSPCFKEHKICFLDGEVYPPEQAETESAQA